MNDEREARVKDLIGAIYEMRMKQSEIEKHSEVARTELKVLMGELQIRDFVTNGIAAIITTTVRENVKADAVRLLCSPEVASKLIVSSAVVTLTVRRAKDSTQ